MFKARGQPGCWYGYVDIDGVTYKIDARHVGERVNKHFEGTVKKHVPRPKPPQRDLALMVPTRREIINANSRIPDSAPDPDFPDSPEDI